MAPKAIQTHLARLPLLCSVVPEELSDIAQHSRELELARNETLFCVGDKPDAFFCVKCGQMKLTLSTPTGIEKVIELIGPGQSFAEALLFLDKASPVTAQAIEQTTLIQIPGQVILGSIRRSPEFTRRLLAGLSQRLHYLISDVESYCLLSSSQRVAGYLLQELERCQRGKDDMKIRLPASKGTIASRLNLTPETLSRTLHHLVEEGVIGVSGKTIAVRDLERLREHGRSV